MHIAAEDRLAQFHKLKIKDIKCDTNESISVSFSLEKRLKSIFSHYCGQYVTLKAVIDGKEHRRPYSICSGVGEDELKIGIKVVVDGIFSNYLKNNIKIGDQLAVMPPEGNFIHKLNLKANNRYIAFAAGSGITPVLGILKSVLQGEPLSHFMLFYGNRNINSIMFKQELDDLKDKFPARFGVFHVLSREPMEKPLQSGHLDANKLQNIFDSLVNPRSIDAAYLCGPYSMIDTLVEALPEFGIRKQDIYFEHFTSKTEPFPIQSTKPSSQKSFQTNAINKDFSEVTIQLDGTTTTFLIDGNKETVLEGALTLRPEVPYACKAGMCCSCRAKVITGSVKMDVNYTLAAEEIKRGFVLACQSRPRSKKLVLDFDAR